MVVSGLLLPLVADDPREDEAGVHADPHVHVDVVLPPHVLRRRGRHSLSGRFRQHQCIINVPLSNDL